MTPTERQAVSKVWLARNKMQRWPDELFLLVNLKSLYLPHNELESIPEAISKLSNLELLNVQHNKITKLTACIVACQSLRTLYLSDNPLPLQFAVDIDTHDKVTRFLLSACQFCFFFAFFDFNAACWSDCFLFFLSMF